MLDGEARRDIEAAAGREGSIDVPLGNMTTLGCGGPAAMMIKATSGDALAAILSAAESHSVPWFVLGRGSNVLIADSGWDGLIITLAGDLKECSREGVRLTCGGGASLPRAARLAQQQGLSGLEPMALIPGTIGGAVAMNAGAYGASISELLETVEVCLPGEIRTIAGSELEAGYRSGGLPPGSVVSLAVLQLTEADPETVAARMKELRVQREASQPVGQKTCGSVFRNPVAGTSAAGPGTSAAASVTTDKSSGSEGHSAGWLLDRSGCKGLASGGAEVSETHANFIINKGNAAAADVIDLMNICRRRVKEKFGVFLEPEVRLLGDISLEEL